MATLSENATDGDLILFEEDGNYSRDVATIASGADLPVHTVLGLVTASGKYVQSVRTAVDGSENAVAVLLTPAAAAAADVTDAVILARHARVRRTALVFDASYSTEAHRDAACALLLGQGIKSDG